MPKIPIVDDFMDKKFPKLKPDMTIADAVKILIKKKMTGAVVVNDNGDLVGILSEKDCLETLLHDSYSRSPSGFVKDYMHTDVETVESTMDIIAVAQKFLKSTFRRLPVVDNKKLVGQITRRDILKGVSKYYK